MKIRRARAFWFPADETDRHQKKFHVQQEGWPGAGRPVVRLTALAAPFKK